MSKGFKRPTTGKSLAYDITICSSSTMQILSSSWLQSHFIFFKLPKLMWDLSVFNIQGRIIHLILICIFCKHFWCLKMIAYMVMGFLLGIGFWLLTCFWQFFFLCSYGCSLSFLSQPLHRFHWQIVHIHFTGCRIYPVSLKFYFLIFSSCEKLFSWNKAPQLNHIGAIHTVWLQLETDFKPWGELRKNQKAG